MTEHTASTPEEKTSTIVEASTSSTPVEETPVQEYNIPKPIKKKISSKGFNLLHVEKRVTATFSIMAKLFIIGLISVAVIFIARELTNDSYVIQQVNVPESFSQAGYTGPVVAQLISLKLNDIIRITRSSEIAEEYKSGADLADVQVDMVGMGVPVRGVIELIGNAIGMNRKKKINALITIDGQQAVLIINVSGAQPERFEVPMDVNLGAPIKLLVAEASEAIFKNTNDEVLSLYYAKLHDAQKIIKLARYQLEKYKGDSKMEAKALSAWALGLFYDGKSDLALAKVNEALTLSEMESDIFSTRAFIQDDMDDLAGAMASDKKAYALLDLQAPKSSRARILNNIGYDYTRVKQYDSAAAYYERAMEWDPGSNFAYYNVSILQLLKNDTTRFFETMETALARGYSAGLIPTDPDLKAMLNHPRMKKLLEKYSEE